jgi:hypothetical protein
MELLSVRRQENLQCFKSVARPTCTLNMRVLISIEGVLLRGRNAINQVRLQNFVINRLYLVLIPTKCLGEYKDHLQVYNTWFSYF